MAKEHNKKTGSLGEKIAAKYLQQKGFSIAEQNYAKKYGEIDIIARRNSIVHFVEVKTVSYETIDDLKKAISRGTWRPEEQVHALKLRKIANVAETWLAENYYVEEWQIDVVAVRIVPRETYASVKYIENVIAE